MVQYKKDDIKNKIDAAALRILSQKGYERTTISDIAKDADISVGNIYRYYKSKEDIFNSLVPESVIDHFKQTLIKKVSSARDVVPDGVEKAGMFSLMNEEFIDFMVSNRERMTILFKGAKGTKYEQFKEEVIKYLIKVVRENYSGKDNQVVFNIENEDVITMIFTKLIEMMIDTLGLHNSESEIKASLKIINTYHLFGVTDLFK